ncbi:MAG: zf-HC2 domain-containing protein [Desulfobacteraceae bacterium]|nr:zf-HC2 domain-containing protein [Desulfobacteraceae bacterium]
MKKTCKMAKMVSAFADGQLSEQDRERLVRHLEVCDACQKEYSDIRSIGRLLSGSEELPPSAGFAEAFWRKVEKTQKTRAHSAWLNWRAWGFRPVWAAAAATIVIALGVLLYRQPQPRSLDEAGDAAALLISEDMELYDNLEIIQHLDLLEHWDVISSMKAI